MVTPKDRIVELRRVPASSLIPHPKNWRRHPADQERALAKVLEDVGIADAVLAYPTPDGLQLIDGHLRQTLLGDQEVPVLGLDLTPEEGEKMLAVLDPLSKMADQDSAMLESLLDSIGAQDEAVQALLDSLLVRRDERHGWNPEPSPDAESVHDVVGYDLQSVWPAIDNSEALVGPYLVPLPTMKGAAKGAFKQAYSRSPASEMERIVRTYMRPGDYFLESCAGWFTFSMTAALMGYVGVGMDIWDVSLEFGKRQNLRIPAGHGEYVVLPGDAMALPCETNQFDFAYCNPPFYTLEKYSDDARDLGSRKTEQEWLDDSGKLMAELGRVVKPGQPIVTVMADYRREKTLIPVHSAWVAEGERQGLILHDIVVQTMRTQSVRMWRHAYNARRSVKAHEYVIVWRSP